jgi:hypothetical protein
MNDEDYYDYICIMKENESVFRSSNRRWAGRYHRVVYGVGMQPLEC